MYGDRRTELVCIGADLDCEAARAQLEECCLTWEEMGRTGVLRVMHEQTQYRLGAISGPGGCAMEQPPSALVQHAQSAQMQKALMPQVEQAQQAQQTQQPQMKRGRGGDQRRQTGVALR